MHFLSPSQCNAWLRDRGRAKPSADNSPHHQRVRFPKEATRWYWFARQVAAVMMQDREPCLLWIGEWGIWDQNLHLYYRLRRGYDDAGLLEDAPGHLFLAYESEDLATFLQLSMLNGWGGTILTQLDYLNASFSHDEFIDFWSNTESRFNEALELLRDS